MASKFGIGDKLVALFLALVFVYKLMSFSLFLLTMAGAIPLMLFYLNYEKSHWNRVGVPSPERNLFFGNTMDMLREDSGLWFTENFKKYGDKFGVYLMDHREIFSMDLDFLRSVYVKEFNHFQNRMNPVNSSPSIEKNSIMQNGLNMKKGEAWKRVRNRVTPAFTTGKIKKVIPYMNDSANQLCKVIDENIRDGKDLDLKDLFGRLALDVIGRAGFSLDMNTFDRNSENPFYINAKEVFQKGFMNWKVLVLIFFPFIATKLEVLLGLNFFESSPHHFFKDFLLDLYNQRKKERAEGQEPRNDIFQILMDVVDDDKATSNINGEEDADIIHNWVVNAPAKHISTMELLAQGFILLVAGYETTGSTLHFIIYCLAALPDIQEKVRDEIKTVVGDEKEITYEHINKLIYMDQVIQETLRMYPAAPRVNRECNKAITIKGIPMEEGDLVCLPIYSIHYSPEFYPEPERFDPDRFTAEEKARRDPLTYAPFGYGPRNCIGMRFAEFEIRTCLAIVLRNFRFHKIDGSPELPLKVINRELTRPTETLFARAERI